MISLTANETVKELIKLFFRSGNAVVAVNLLSLYRVIAAPVLLIFIIIGKENLFRWLLILSFLTDALDGFLARKFNAATVTGAKLDSIGDLLTFAVAVTGLIITRPEFIKDEWAILAILIGLNLFQIIISIHKFGKVSSFHTYLAKAAAVALSLFLISTFFISDILYPLFYIAIVVSALNVFEEIILVYLLPEWRANVKGVYWVLSK